MLNGTTVHQILLSSGSQKGWRNLSPHLMWAQGFGVALAGFGPGQGVHTLQLLEPRQGMLLPAASSGQDPLQPLLNVTRGKLLSQPQASLYLEVFWVGYPVPAPGRGRPGQGGCQGCTDPAGREHWG